MRRIRVLTKCVADNFCPQENERIIEFFDPQTKQGGLISLRRTEDGQLIVCPYNLDHKVKVTCRREHLLLAGDTS
jgi:hypothetical protein